MYFVSFNQTKKVERDAVSSSENEDDKEDKVTVAYKSTRSAVSLWNINKHIWLFNKGNWDRLN